MHATLRTLGSATLLAALPALCVLPAAGQPGNDDPQKKAVFQLLDLAEVAITRDDAQPGRPVVAVDFSDQSGFQDDWLKILQAFPGLRTLRLDRTRVSDAGLKHLPALRNLRTLDLRGTSVSAAAIAQLRQALPELQVTTGPAPGDAPASAAPVKFTAAQIKKLRAAADEAVPLPENLAEGWIKSPVDPARLLPVFAPLRVRSGMVLRAYLFTAGANGNGVVWALPADAEFPAPKDCPALEGHLLNAPKPSEALDDVMEAIEGDGSGESYMMASFLRRQFAAFAARWHGATWSVHNVLDANPFTRTHAPDDDPTSFPTTSVDQWKWNAAQPTDWSPQVQVEGNRVIVTFYTYCGLEKQRIFRHTDTYRAGKYRPKVEQQTIAENGPGFMF